MNLRYCRTPLHAAAFSDHVECISLLLSHGAKANAVDTLAHKTPLMMAALNGQTNAVGERAHRLYGCLKSLKRLEFQRGVFKFWKALDILFAQCCYNAVMYI